uniref:hypothetical protein n=1 Tax=Dixoniella grisea TaxID=35153 RepID=UPI001FCD0133|nr:hypothetical protein MW560_pgp157 [Dixoniella grisea]UNJ17074.1 hypothetical protein [Dixoniella grisea]
MSLLIIGATGNLGRQIVKQALDEGYQVRCLVRNLRKAIFLREWGAELIYGDVCILETIPRCLYNISGVIDTFTTRPFDTQKSIEIDLYSKIYLIHAAQVAKVYRYIFFSIVNAKFYNNVPLMNFKVQIEYHLKESTLKYSIFQVEGFFQGIIQQYAIPVLENQAVWTTKETISLAYIDTIDVAKITMKSLNNPKMEKCILPLLGNKSWSSTEVIILCETLSGQTVKKRYVSLTILFLLRKILLFFAWTENIGERLSFIEIFTKPIMNKNVLQNWVQILDTDFMTINRIEIYLQDYFNRILQKVKTLNFEQNKNQNQNNNAKIDKF